MPRSESIHSNKALYKILQHALQKAELPLEAVQLIETTDRAAVGALLQQDQYIDVIIPRGGKSLTARIAAESRIPVIKHLDGICHIYIDKAADAEKSIAVCLNAKMRRPGICGAVETILVHQDIVQTIGKEITCTLLDAGCAVRGDAAVQTLDNRVAAATEEDWGTEYLAPIISIKTIPNINKAIQHINHYGSHHTDAILTEDSGAAHLFMRSVDSGIVMHNTSTQFADGGEFGFGAEIGISTGKLHARGPVGAQHLTTIQYRVVSNGGCRS
jgi:glutamate-5-semialdehyde dehydrogenase